VKEQFPFFPVAPDGKRMVLSCDMVPENADFWIVKPYYISNGMGVQSRAAYSPQLNYQFWIATASRSEFAASCDCAAVGRASARQSVHEEESG